jgi:hypothetical protein
VSASTIDSGGSLMNRLLEDEHWLRRNVVAIVGFAINLLVLGVYIGRQAQLIDMIEKRTSTLELRVNDHNQDGTVHTSSEWRVQLLATVNRIEGKVDAHIMRDTDVLGVKRDK